MQDPYGNPITPIQNFEPPASDAEAVDITPKIPLFAMRDTVVSDVTYPSGAQALTSNPLASTVGGLQSNGSTTQAGSGNSIFMIDPQQGIWLGNALFASAPFSVSMTGVLKATSGTFSGTITATSGTIANWTISPTALSTGAFNTLNTMYFGSSGLSLSNVFSVTNAGALTASSGVIGGFTITSTSLYGGIIKTALTVGVGSTGVIMDTAGLRGYDSVLGLTFNLPTNGSAPSFSSGIINSTIFNVNTNAVLRTSATVGDGSASSHGVLINPTGFYACEDNQLLANANVRILSDGSGYFSGEFEIGGAVKTIDNVADIQTSLNEIGALGGGTVWLKAGTYTLTSNISIPGACNLVGVSRDNCIIECGNYSILMSGSNPYSAGTVTINNGDTTVVGSGTTWTSGMVGQSIWLDSNWYEILSFSDGQHITIGIYSGVNLASQSYVIATITNSPRITTVTVQNSTSSGIKSYYSNNPVFDDLNVYGSVIGIDLQYSLFPEINSYTIENGINLSMDYVSGAFLNYSSNDFSTSGEGIKMTNVTLSSIYNSTANGNTTNGLTMTDCIDNTIFDNNFSSNGGNGVSMTNCSTFSFISVSTNSNGAKGIEFISGNNDGQITDAQVDSNTSDGIKLTATTDRVSICQTSITNNGGYGVNIAASTCDNNIINSPAFDSNASGNINDAGTGTSVLPQQVNPSFGDGSDGDVTIAAGTTTLTRDMYYNNLVVTGTLVTANWRVFVKGTLSGAGTIQNNGGDGGAGADQATTAGTAGAKVSDGYFVTLPGKIGGSGGINNNSGYDGVYGDAISTSIGVVGVNGGKGGGTSTPNNVAGVKGALTAVLQRFGITRTQTISAIDYSLTGTSIKYNGSSGSGSGSGGQAGNYAVAGGGGGGSGAAGGILYLIVNTWTGTVTINAKGGNGGKGGNGQDAGGASTPGRGGGGGGGGSGGIILVIYNVKSWTGSYSVAGGTKGAGGTGGQNGGVYQASGAAGTDGNSGIYKEIKMNDLA